MHDQNSFITLTYSDEHLPWDGSLTKSHFQTFIRDLRYAFKATPLRYFMCGEYGENLKRPHYHACLFGIDFQDKELWKETEGILTWTSEKLETIWGKGFCTIGDLNFDTAAYTARYITKKITGDQAQDHYQTTCCHTGALINLEPEYTTMSRKPGIALEWLKKFRTDIFPSDYLIQAAAKIPIPRYYENQLTEEALAHFKNIRKERAKLNAQNNTPERLAVREKIKHLQHNKLSRSYEHGT